jgi:hypothetical protein
VSFPPGEDPPRPRYAIYWAPAEASGLWRAGAAWLGRDPSGQAPGAPPDLPGDVTRDPAVYGFHATLKPPMRLADGVSRAALLTAARRVAASVPPFPLPPLAVTVLDGFLCLRETRESAALQACCDAFVAGLDELRAPPPPAELARRRAAGLSGAQEANLTRWGYPHVFATWFFHMTLSRRLSGEEVAIYRPLAEAWFAQALGEPLMVRDICIFTQAAPGAGFTLEDRLALG